MRSLYLKLFIFLLFSVSCSLQNPSFLSRNETSENKKSNNDPQTLSKEDRLLGLDLSNFAEEADFYDNINLAKQAGIDFFTLHLEWDDIEITDGSGSTSGTLVDPNNNLADCDLICDTYDLKLNLTIKPIDMTGKTIPGDLDTVSFDNVNMAIRFYNVIDFVLTKIKLDNLTCIMIGNEIDYFNITGQPESVNGFWADYGAFLFNLNYLVDTNISESLNIGFTGTLYGLIDESKKTVFSALAGIVDVLGVTYYPQDVNFNVKPPSVVDTDLEALTTEYNTSTIFFQEAGYQSASACSSNETLQVDFVKNMFHEWDVYKDKIKSVNFLRLSDISRAAAEDVASDYGITSEAFIEYLRTLGLRTYSGMGIDKKAFTELVEQANLRGWK